ncbi:hypothetical protein GOP47_0030259 [Adiantum capillus-veneris]|nr:hypothetical protein GOP47_0030259 [Adiantum capillus-veneris]
MHPPASAGMLNKIIGKLEGRSPQKLSINGPIKTIVVLVMENRSFDHMLGWMKKLDPDIDGVTGRESNPLNLTDPNSPLVYFSDYAEFVDPDPGHSFQAIRAQVFGASSEKSSSDGSPPPMSGFASQAETIAPNMSSTVMSGFRPEVIPVYTSLAQEFAICDCWFASVPASTQPNRLFVHSATSHGATSNNQASLAAGYPQRTIFDNIYDAGLSFGIYYQNVPSTLFYRSLRQIKHVDKFRPYGLWFKRDAKSGSLPNYVVIEPRYFDVAGAPANDDHPSHDVAEGQKLVKEVYETLRASPQWNQTLFVVTYDEHGGYFDHVPTPVKSVPSPDNITGPAPFNFTFNRLGVRVPTFLISPWINKGTVLHEPINGPTSSSQYEHSSLPATVKKLFNLPSDYLTQRDAWAGSFEHLLYERSTPRTDCPEVLPSSPWSLRHAAIDGERATSEFQQEMVEMAAAISGPGFGTEEDAVLAKKSVNAADGFVELAVSHFLKVGEDALTAGVDGSMLVQAIQL